MAVNAVKNGIVIMPCPKFRHSNEPRGFEFPLKHRARINVTMAVFVKDKVDGIAPVDRLALGKPFDKAQIAIGVRRAVQNGAREKIEARCHDAEFSAGTSGPKGFADHMAASRLGHMLDHVLAKKGVECPIRKRPMSCTIHIDSVRWRKKVYIQPSWQAISARPKIELGFVGRRQITADFLRLQRFFCTEQTDCFAPRPEKRAT